MTPEIEALVLDYKAREASLSEREKAEMEASIWTLVPTKGISRREFFKDLFGGKTTEYDNRQGLQRVGSLADPLWKRIDSKDMPVFTAVDLLARAKKEAKKIGRPLQAVIAFRVAEYDQFPYVKHLASGFRLRIPGSKERWKPETEEIKPPIEDDRAFWKMVRERILPFIQNKLKGADPIVAEQLFKNFEVELKGAMYRLQTKISKATHANRNEVKHGSLFIDRNAVREACFLLAIDPPAFGKHVDLDKAVRKKRQLAQLYHPDKHGGDESLRPKYEQVMKAYDTLEEYNQQLPIGDERKTNGGDEHGSR